MSAIGEYAVRGAVTGSIVGGITGLVAAPLVGCVGLAFQIAIETVGKQKLKNKDSLWDNPFVITPLCFGAAGAAIGAITNVGMYYFTS